MTTWIASRTLSDASGGAALTVSIAAPEQVSSYEWKCAVRLQPAAGAETIEYARGDDAIQALVMSLENLRIRVGAIGGLTWAGGEPGDPGLPRTVPLFYGLTFAQKLGQLVDDEIAKFANAAKAKHSTP